MGASLLAVAKYILEDLRYVTYLLTNLACSAGVFFERAICSRKRQIETSRREEEMGRVKGSGEGEGREKRKRKEKREKRNHETKP